MIHDEDNEMNVNAILSLNETSTPRLLSSVAVAFGIGVLVIASFYSFRQWHQDWELVHLRTPDIGISTAADDANTLIASIPDAHLFGKPLTEGGVPLSNLQLRLTGIVQFDNNKTASKVYISTQGQPSKVFHIGDRLTQGVSIYAIQADKVILDNEGQLEKLPLARPKLLFRPRTHEES